MMVFPDPRLDPIFGNGLKEQFSHDLDIKYLLMWSRKKNGDWPIQLCDVGHSDVLNPLFSVGYIESNRALMAGCNGIIHFPTLHWHTKDTSKGFSSNGMSYCRQSLQFLKSMSEGIDSIVNLLTFCSKSRDWSFDEAICIAIRGPYNKRLSGLIAIGAPEGLCCTYQVVLLQAIAGVYKNLMQDYKETKEESMSRLIELLEIVINVRRSCKAVLGLVLRASWSPRIDQRRQVLGKRGS